MLKIYLSLLLIILFSLPQMAQKRWDLPDEPVGRTAAKFLDALSAGEESAFRQLILQSFSGDLRDAHPMEAHLGFLQELSQQLGKFEIVGVDIPSGQKIKLALMGKEGPPLKISLEIGSEPPYLINGLRIGDAGAEEKQFGNLDELKAYLEGESAAGRFSGAAMILHNDALLFQKAYGFANREKKIVNRLGTRFNIGSINKEITAVAIAQLAEKGLLDLDDSIDKWLPDYPQPAAKKITIRNLLQHRAGTGDYLMQAGFMEKAASMTTVDQFYQFLKDQPLLFEPGEKQRYSNSGYVILGKIVEAVTGVDYYDYVRENVYRPANMPDSDSFDPGTHTENHAIAYSTINSEDGTPHPGRKFYNKKGSPAGGGYSTLRDLANFDAALRQHKLLSPKFTALLVNRFRPLPEGAGPGGGLGIAGGAPGLNAILESDWDIGYTVVVLANMDPPVAEELGIAIMEMLRQQ